MKTCQMSAEQSFTVSNPSLKVAELHQNHHESAIVHSVQQMLADSDAAEGVVHIVIALL